MYHYDPSRHMAEQRGRGDFEMTLASDSAPIVFVLTSIVWREAWKYDERAYRYCLHDIGHAWQALALSARAIGCDSFAAGLSYGLGAGMAITEAVQLAARCGAACMTGRGAYEGQLELSAQ